MKRDHSVAIVTFLLALAALPASAAGGEEAGSEMREEGKNVNPVVLMKTTMGEIEIELFADKAPITVDNFLSYVDDKFYDGTIFHRVIESFVIQGGGYTTEMVKKETKPEIRNEADNGLANTRGTIAMARLPQPHTATSQFFINVRDNANLDHFDKVKRYGYCVFGKVTRGMDVIDKIRKVPTGAKPPFRQDAPLETIEIVSVRRVAPK